VKPVIGHAEIEACVRELEGGHVRFDHLDPVSYLLSAGLSARQLQHVRRYISGDVTNGLPPTQPSKRESTPARYVEDRRSGREVPKSRDFRVHEAHVGTPLRPDTNLCNPVVLHAGVVNRRYQAINAPPLVSVGHLSGRYARCGF
jgi:hypothetical protein